MNSKGLHRRLLLSVVFGVVVFFAILALGDTKKTLEALRTSDWMFVPFVLLLALGNYAIRFVRWEYYLRRLSISIPARSSVTIFMSGLAMSITPGKLGELVKCAGLKEAAQTPFSKSASVVFAERFTDLFAVLMLAGIGGLSFHYGQTFLLITLGVLLVLLGILINKNITEKLLSLFLHIPKLERFIKKVLELYEHMYTLLRFTPLFWGIVFGGIAWFCECLGFSFILRAVHHVLPLGEAIFIYAFATLFGAVTFLPGGLGATEGSLTGLLILNGVPKEAASAASLLIRGATLWFAVLVGMAWYLPNQKHLEANIPNEPEAYAAS